MLIIISSRKSNIYHRPQTFPVFNGKPKKPEKEHKDVVKSSKRLTAYPNPSHASIALAVLVTIRPYVSIIGKIPETEIDIKKARNALDWILD